MEAIKNKVMISIFLIFIFGLSIANVVDKDREISETENRPLQQFPQFSFESLLSGSYTQKFDKYMTCLLYTSSLKLLFHKGQKFTSMMQQW